MREQLKYKYAIKGTLLAVCYTMACVVIFGFSIGGVAAPNGQVTVAANQQRSDPTLILTRGKAETVRVNADISDILIANPSVLDVTVLQSGKLYIVGRAIGDTNLIVLDREGNTVQRMNIHVTLDSETLQNAIDELFPQERVFVKTLSDQVILTGSASSALVASRIGDLAQRFVQSDDGLGIVNMVDVKGEQQVSLRVKIVEVSRSILKEFGVETNFNDPLNTAAADPLFDTVRPENISPENNDISSQLLGDGSITGAPAAITRFIADPAIRGIGTIEVLFRALESENMLNTLAEPNLTALSGEEASFLAGGEFPVPAGIDDSGNTVFTYRPFGVTLNFRPTVLSNDRIALQLETEVSSRDTTSDANVGGVQLPAFDVSRASSTVELGSGGSLMIAGLLNSRTLDGISGLPGIKDSPVIGDLIKSQRFQRDESEVLVIVTAFLAKPYKDNLYADEKPQPKPNPLAQVFAATIRERYGAKADVHLVGEETYGYLLD